MRIFVMSPFSFLFEKGICFGERVFSVLLLVLARACLCLSVFLKRFVSLQWEKTQTEIWEGRKAWKHRVRFDKSLFSFLSFFFCLFIARVALYGIDCMLFACLCKKSPVHVYYPSSIVPSCAVSE